MWLCCPTEQGFVLLCEVALGKMMRLRKADEHITLQKITEKGFNSTMGEGTTGLDPAGDETLFVQQHSTLHAEKQRHTALCVYGGCGTQ